LPLLVAVEHLLRRRQQRFVAIVGAAELIEEEGQVLSLGEAGELRDIIQADVDQPLDPGAPQGPEEFQGRLPAETDRIDVHPTALDPASRAMDCNTSRIREPSPRLVVRARAGRFRACINVASGVPQRAYPRIDLISDLIYYLGIGGGDERRPAGQAS